MISIQQQMALWKGIVSTELKISLLQFMISREQYTACRREVLAHNNRQQLVARLSAEKY